MSHTAEHEITPEFLDLEQKRYFTFMSLAFLMTALTGIELVLIFLPFPGSILLFSSLVILSLIKFIGVIFWFMHLIYDRMLLTIIFLFGMLIATGTAIALMLLFTVDDVDQSLPFFQDNVRHVIPADTKAKV